MKIETKYNIGDEVWWGIKECIASGIVNKVNINIFQDYVFVSYVVVSYGDFPLVFSLSEKDLFPTKEELLKSLEQDKND